MIPERERKALMQLTLCARTECPMCIYEDECNFEFQYETATRCMNILVDALRIADHKTEPQTEEHQELEAYRKCIKSWSFWDAKHCDGCMFYDDCPFDPREDEDEPQTEREGE